MTQSESHKAMNNLAQAFREYAEAQAVSLPSVNWSKVLPILLQLIQALNGVESPKP